MQTSEESVRAEAISQGLESTHSGISQVYRLSTNLFRSLRLCQSSNRNYFGNMGRRSPYLCQGQERYERRQSSIKGRIRNEGSWRTSILRRNSSASRQER